MTPDVASLFERLEAEGYRDGFVAEPSGLRAVRDGRVFAPEALVVDGIRRVESDSDPEQQAIVFLLHDPASAVRGVYSTAHGPLIDLLDARIVGRLTLPRRP